jgi:hypothetical protein
MAAMRLGERWPLVLLPMRYRSFLEKAKNSPHAIGFAGLRLAEPA